MKPEPLILIDTSVWIDFFRNKKSEVGDKAEALIRQNRACITGVIIAELLQGIKTDTESNRLNQLLQVIPVLETQHQHWLDAGNDLRKCRSQGITLPLTDALIGAIASEAGAKVLSLDKHFNYLPVERY